ncbi:hypothetical protein [Cecembia rubra]|uniref:Uncharacterized protein n=1 Tax=Cecembia rubra TaxID=1485585 RepID=A0A2P8E7S0_9BACT|nr:hypothetical protein [Cecembia rubra]PSL05524.1 hypothetical protein CLV48_10334 [Cecembia rubra]
MKRISLILTICALSFTLGLSSSRSSNLVVASNFLKMAEARLCFGDLRYLLIVLDEGQDAIHTDAMKAINKKG